MKRLLLALLLLASPAAAQWPGGTNISKSTAVNSSESGVSCTETCAPLACSQAFRERTALGVAENESVQNALGLDTTQELLDANWGEGFDLTGEFDFTASLDAVEYKPLVAGTSIVVDIECVFVGSRTTGGNNRAVSLQIARGLGGLDPTNAQGEGLTVSVTTPSDGSAFSITATDTLTLAENDTIGMLVNGDTIMNIDSYVSRCRIERVSAGSSTDCTDTFDVRRCLCE